MMKRTVVTCILLFTLTFTAFWQVFGNGFVSYDDPDYVTENPQVLRGLTVENLAWAFQLGHAGNWHPLTWISHMLDVQLFGMNPAGHHAMSVVLHAAAAVLLLLLLADVTGRFWPSVFVAGVFALHPLHVESVAWIAERKDVLSSLFLVITLWAYALYVRKGRGRESQASTRTRNGSVVGYYGLALLFFALGLMSKPMLVTLPFVLLLLDYWPFLRFGFSPPEEPTTTSLSSRLGRFGRRNFWLLLEKLPFAALALVSSILTFLAQNKGGAVATLEALPLGFRLSNAAISYVRYLGKIFWPADLAVIYPLPVPRQWPIEWTLGAALLLATITMLALWRAKKYPFLPVGWFWFLGTLVPVIGLVQVGQQAMADRYAHIPSIGISLVIAWGAAEILARRAMPRRLVGAVAAAALATCFFVTYAQTAHWQNSITLFAHAVNVTRDNAIAHNNLGSSLMAASNYAEAEPQIQAALRIRPAYPEALVNLAVLREKQGRATETAVLLQQALRAQPTAAGHYNLANVLTQQGQLAEAEKHYEAALKLKPQFVEAVYNLGILKSKQGLQAEALELYEAALKWRPGYAEARVSLGATLASQQHFDQAISQFETVLQADRGNTDAKFNLAMAREAKGDLSGAAVLYAELVQAFPEDLQVRMNLGVVCLKGGRMAEAAEQFRVALRILSPSEADADLAELGASAAPPNSNAVARVHHYLALAKHSQGRLIEALAHYRRAAGLAPSTAIYLNDLAWVLATHSNDDLRNGTEALRLAEIANELTGHRQPALLGTLAAAYAETGRFAEAVTTAEKAVKLAHAAGQRPIADANQQLLKLYQARKPARQ